MNSPESVPMLSNLKAYLHYQYPATTGDILLNTQCDYITSLESDKAMLDWLEENGKRIALGFPTHPHAKFWIFGDEEADDIEADSLRLAITQAMQKEPKQ